MSNVHVLTQSSVDLNDKLQEIQKLALLVFEPEVAVENNNIEPISEQLQLKNWNGRLSKSNATIVYISNIDNINDSDSTSRPVITGFFFNHPRPRDRSKDSYHIYLAAVHPSARGQNIFSKLLDRTRNIAIEAGYEKLTVSTFPDRFTTMYAILSRPGSGWKELGWRDAIDKNGKKVVMEMPLL